MEGGRLETAAFYFGENGALCACQLLPECGSGWSLHGGAFVYASLLSAQHS